MKKKLIQSAFLFSFGCLCALPTTEDIIEIESILTGLAEEVKGCQHSDSTFQAYLEASETLKEIKDIYAASKDNAGLQLSKIDRLKEKLYEKINYIRKQMQVCSNKPKLTPKEVTLFNQSSGTIRTPNINIPIQYNLPPDTHQEISIGGLMPETAK